MSSLEKRVLAFAALVLTVLCAVTRPTVAQCPPRLNLEAPVAMMPSNPLRAERTTTRTPAPKLNSVIASLSSPVLVARDSAGRLEFDRTIQTLHMQTGPDAGTDVEDHAITICDPEQGLSANVDTANKTARVQQLAPFRGIPLAVGQSSVFCRVPDPQKDSAHPPNPTVEDLGHRTIEGFDTHGWRFTTSIHLPNTTPDATLQQVREVWCSEELGAVLLEVFEGSGTGHREEIELTKIQRTEPDPSLFEIPSDYTVSQTPRRPFKLVGPLRQSPPLVTH